MSATSPRRAAAGHPAPLADPDGDDDAEDDAQRVGAERQRAEVPDALAGLGIENGSHQAAQASRRRAVVRSAREVGDGWCPAVQTTGAVAVRAKPVDVGAVGDRRSRRAGSFVPASRS